MEFFMFSHLFCFEEGARFPELTQMSLPQCLSEVDIENLEELGASLLLIEIPQSQFLPFSNQSLKLMLILLELESAEYGQWHFRILCSPNHLSLVGQILYFLFELVPDGYDSSVVQIRVLWNFFR